MKDDKLREALDFRLDGELLGTIAINEDNWKLSERKTFEVAYKSGYISREDKCGWSYALWLERPLRKKKE